MTWIQWDAWFEEVVARVVGCSELDSVDSLAGLLSEIDGGL